MACPQNDDGRGDWAWRRDVAWLKSRQGFIDSFQEHIHLGLKHIWAAQDRKPLASLLLVVRPGAPSSVLAPSSDARSP